MSFFANQALNGLSYATTLFLMAAGLTLIFGVAHRQLRARQLFHAGRAAGGALGDQLVPGLERQRGPQYALAMLLGAAAAALA